LNLFFQLVFIEFIFIFIFFILELALVFLTIGFLFGKGVVWTKNGIGHFRSDDGAAGTYRDPYAGLPAAQAKRAPSWFL
jgi:hypothetical protein